MANGRGSLGLGRMNCDSSMFGPARLGEKKNLKTKCRAHCPVCSVAYTAKQTDSETSDCREAKHGADVGCYDSSCPVVYAAATRWQRNGGYPLLQFDLDQLNWHGRACHEAERYQAQTMEALPVGLLGRLYYLSKILKLSINRERRTSLIKIIHALLLASPAYCSASPYSQDSSSIELAPAA